MNGREELRRAARSIFDATLAQADARLAVRRALDFTRGRLTILDTEFDLREQALAVYSIAVGKAAGAMACALDEVLGERIAGGVISAPPVNVRLSERWQVFAGGHPLPNEASMKAARAAFALLQQADAERALIVFLISGGGSAMLEWPRDENVTLAELQAANRALVSCGASIDEINAVRRAFSSVKSGGLAACAPHAAQISLIFSDTRRDEPYNVASGLTYDFPRGETTTASEVVARYGLAAQLPASILRAVKRPRPHRTTNEQATLPRLHHVLLDNELALERAAEFAATLGFTVETARDVSEQAVEEGARLLVSRLLDLRGREASGGRRVCLISGGEFSCPVRGTGVGGRNAETILRCALEIEARAARLPASERAHVVALSAGTDGIDGNSPAAGALCDETTLTRARALSLNAQHFLATSDAHTFFDALGDAVTTGATGTNVRDLRVFLAQ
ncbi:MAG TPA: DUF4147 domain-containing protein [Pyrinomonadaceae bacterium]|nr:DUF4147 domain-containing protein [Pyrinomonadaceae bacterium]